MVRETEVVKKTDEVTKTAFVFKKTGGVIRRRVEWLKKQVLTFTKKSW